MCYYACNNLSKTMRKLKLQLQVSIDGYLAGPGGELDWMVWNWDNELKKYIFNLTRPVDCILLGKNLANVFIDTWQQRLKEKSTDSFARKMVDTPKVVFSRTMNKISWKNTRLANGNLIEEVNRLKNMKGRDIIVYGGVSFLSSLIKTGLIDEYNFFINPVLLGDGISIFRNPEFRLNLDLVYSTSFDCGITALCYIPKRSRENNTESMSWISNSAEDK